MFDGWEEWFTTVITNASRPAFTATTISSASCCCCCCCKPISIPIALSIQKKYRLFYSEIQAELRLDKKCHQGLVQKRYNHQCRKYLLTRTGLKMCHTLMPTCLMHTNNPLHSHPPHPAQLVSNPSGYSA